MSTIKITELPAATEPIAGSSVLPIVDSNNTTVKATILQVRQMVSVKDFGAVGDGVANDTVAFQNAINTGKRVYVPKGTYLVNVSIDSKTIIEGDGSRSSVLKPWDNSAAIMTYTWTAQQTPTTSYWDYHSEVRYIGFEGKIPQTGVGFSFGASTPQGYTTNAEFANNVKFYGCRFFQLNKGVQFPFGNIGTEFYSCGFQSNYYGAYLLDNKFPAGSPAGMHAGNKYWYAGEFSGNVVGLYLNNVTDGFGAVELKDTIMEYNLCAAYFYVSPRVFVPVKFDSVWFEGNGSASSGAATVIVDTWTGATQGTTTLSKKTLFFDGDGGYYRFDNSSPTDIRVMGTNTAVYINNSWVSRSSGFMGGEFVVDNPEKSYIRYEGVTSVGGNPVGANVYAASTPRVEDLTINNQAGPSSYRHFWTLPRTSKVKNYGPSLINSLSLTSPTQLSGTALVGGTVVAQGRIFPVCSEFTRASFLSNQYLNIDSPDSAVTLSAAGYYVVTADIRRTQGNPKFFVWDRSAAQFVSGAEVPELNRWYTLAAIGYNSGTGQSIFFDAQGDGGNCTWQVSAYQVHRFDNYTQAMMFLDSGVFALKNSPITIASASTIYAPHDSDIIPISGTTGITSIDATGQAGRRITLKFAAAVTVTDGSNLKLAGNFTSSADDTLTLICDGTDWFEVARSVN